MNYYTFYLIIQYQEQAPHIYAFNNLNQLQDKCKGMIPKLLSNNVYFVRFNNVEYVETKRELTV